MITFVIATRHDQKSFFANTAMGKSLARLNWDLRLRVTLFCENRLGLPKLYNRMIRDADADQILAFVHDDVWLDDYFIADRIQDGLQHYDVIGVAGNKRRQPGQPGWVFVDLDMTSDDRKHLSGAVAHGRSPFGEIASFGATPAACELLDGVLLVARAGTLRDSNVWFDERFDFHYYDLDFCRTARQNALRVGTWPIAVTHQSGGAFGSAAWRNGYERYIEKWGD